MWNKIKNYGLALGLDDLACADPKADSDLLQALTLRRALNRQLSIEEEDLMARVDPRCHLANVRTVIVAVVQMPVSHPIDIPKGYGRLASLSWGLDYHIFLQERLNALSDYMKKLNPRVDTYVQVDTGPLHERYFAHKSGLGTIGKSGNFIHPTLGTYVAIGLILTNLELPLGKAKDSLCGNCRKCIQACPGNAIKEDGTIDPTHCVSWLTQSKERLSTLDRQKLGDNLYGCDQCQLVCPLNRDILNKDNGRWGPLIKRVKLDFIEQLSNREFKRVFGHLSGSWRGKKTWLRNSKIIKNNQEILCYNEKE